MTSSWTLPPVPTLPPPMTLAPITLPTLPPLATVPPVLISLAPTIAPLISTLAPGASESVTDAVNQVVKKANNIASIGIQNATNTAKSLGDTIQNTIKGASPASTDTSVPSVGDVERVVDDATQSTVDDTSAAVDVVKQSAHDSIQVLPGGASKSPATKVAQEDSGLIPKTAKPFVIPVLGLIIGGVWMIMDPASITAKLVLYFGAQSFMNIFMSWVLKIHETIPAGTMITKPDRQFELEKSLTGCPAGFALTALQQVVSFILFLLFFVSVYWTPKRYMPKKLGTINEILSVAIFGCVFAANIALNNFSLGYISIGVNLIIRSCLPLSTYASQQFLAVFGMYPFKEFKVLEVSLMAIGVFCAAVFTWASFGGNFSAGTGLLGVLACVGSLFCGSLNLALAGVLGKNDLSVLDTCAYMSIPATAFLLPIIFFMSKPVPEAWANIGEKHMTDWAILKLTWDYSPTTIYWYFVSGVFSFMYNLCQFNIVHTLSPSATAFGGNFNKAVLTFMTLLCPFLQTSPNPPMPYIMWEWISLLCNIAAFSYYSYLQVKDKEKESKAHKQMDEESDEEMGSESGSD